MTVKVVDASALAAILFGENEGDGVGQQLEGAQLVAPQLLSFELANVCVKKCRREPDRRDALTAGLRALNGRGIVEMPVDHDAVLSLALETKLSAYDASYLWLALRLDAELVTLDDRLAQAWTARAGR